MLHIYIYDISHLRVKHGRSEKVRCDWRVQETEGLNKKKRVSLMSPDQVIDTSRKLGNSPGREDAVW